MASDITGPDQLSQQLDQLSMDAKGSNNSSREYSSPQTAQGVAISQGAHQEQLESDPSDDNAVPRLETLPAELLYLVDDHLDPADGLVIRVTCHRLRDFSLLETLSNLADYMWMDRTGAWVAIDGPVRDPSEYLRISQKCDCSITITQSRKSPGNTWELQGEKPLDEYASPDERNSLSPLRPSKDRSLLVTTQHSQSEIIGIFPRDEDSICNRIKNWDWEICAHLRVGHLGAQFFEDLCWKAVHWEFVKDSYSATCDNKHCKASFKLTLSTWYAEQGEFIGHRTTSIDLDVFRQVEIHGMEGPGWLENIEAIEDDNKD
ncbi:hypothetical protein IWZ01DRAFT_548679 [Phyllosticta capitalensis]